MKTFSKKLLGKIPAGAVHFFIIAALILFFGFLFFSNRAFGSWGDDSPGYIYLTHKIFFHKPLVYQDALVERGLDFFHKPARADFLAPRHHTIISPDGFVASKYPVGLSFLMVIPVLFTGNLDDIYFVLPFFAVATLVLVYGIAYILVRRWRYSFLIAFLSALALGLSTLYENYGISQPMREIPSIFFLLLALWFLLLLKEYTPKKPVFYVLLALSAISLGFSFNIRETGIILMPAFFMVGLSVARSYGWTWKGFILPALVFCLFLVGTLSLTVWNSAQISAHSVSFDSGTAAPVLLSNIDHLESFSWRNIYDNQGKFRPGEGGIVHYWGVIQGMSPFPFWFVLVVFGMVVYMYRGSKLLGGALIVWVLSVVLLFSLWINPYSRYILPIFPVLAVFGSIGLVSVLVVVVDYVQRRWLRDIIVLACFGVLFIFVQPYALEEFRDQFSGGVLQFKAISHSDLQTLKGIADVIEPGDMEQRLETDDTLLMFSGTWQYGLSETFENHTGIRAIRSPLEQRSAISADTATDFFTADVFPHYQVYAWLDDTSPVVYRDWLTQNFQLDLVTVRAFTFQENVSIYKLTPK